MNSNTKKIRPIILLKKPNWLGLFAFRLMKIAGKLYEISGSKWESSHD